MNDRPHEQSEADTRARQLILQAFEKARSRGQSVNWRTMTTAVLKNRLLAETERSFKESDYGAQNITDFVRRYPDLLLLDDSTRPPKVTLLTDTVITTSPAPSDQSRVRSDLWSATLDYQSGLTYVWDGLLAKPADPSEASQAEPARILPTATASDIDTWRTEFLASVESVLSQDPGAADQARRWASKRLGTKYLPASLRTLWNQELKRNVTDRLTHWFATQGFAPPTDLLHARPAGRSTSVGADTLRQLVLRCVRVMTEEELRRLDLPPAAVLRAYGTAVPGKSPGGTDA